MFRKPKNKTALRQRKTSGNEDDKASDMDKITTSAPSEKVSEDAAGDAEDYVFSNTNQKSSSLLSFDQEEEDDGEEFRIKKNKARQKEARRLKKLEEKMKAADVKEEAISDDELQISVKPVADGGGWPKRDKVENVDDRRNKDRSQDTSVTYVPSQHRERKFKTEEDIISEKLRKEEEKETDIQEKFPSSFSGIPDSRAVFEARKRRERMRREGHDGFIPVDDDQKLREKGTRERLVREDENDDSDEEHTFYSARAQLIEDENRKREKESGFLEHEQGDGKSDEEVDEWEKQQILKAVGRNTIGEIRYQYKQTAEVNRKWIEDENERRRPVEMDIDMDVEHEHTMGSHGDVNPGSSSVSMDDIMAKLSLRLSDREESLNSLRQNTEKLETNIAENKEAIRSLECAGPVIAEKFKMYQMMKLYVRSLLDCLNEKVADVNALVEKRQTLSKMKMERLTRRRRRDVRDAYDECSAAAAGKNPQLMRVNDHGIRAAERDARRMRRRREREKTLEGISHTDGLSSDDEETTSQVVAEEQMIGELKANFDTIFVDALEDYSSLRKVLDHMMDWLSVDGQSFEDAYVHLCIPKLASPYVRMQLANANILTDASFRLDTMQWYVDTLSAGCESEVDPEHKIVVGLVPAIVEKVVVPFLTDVVNEEWDPMSLKQTKNLSTLLASIIEEYPTITEKSKPVVRLMDAVRRRIKECTDEDLFIPMYSKQAIENEGSGCRAFLDRQYWTAIKLMRSINSLSCLLSGSLRFTLVLENIAARTSAMALQMMHLSDNQTIAKVNALMDELREWSPLEVGPSTRTLVSALTKAADEQECKNREFAKKVRSFISK